jgi:hypothetical protein
MCRGVLQAVLQATSRPEETGLDKPSKRRFFRFGSCDMQDF